ncbi:hypothetical protein APS_0642 [Acetobacter pasteurianus subsp. pasteurianus LMG 1262 = NBRC 106471]|nr:hypothetical protein APS_0642 [Acetobacter pasteurianus subsp. pasteurianus LMG 1262 = NBRC 106471]
MLSVHGEVLFSHQTKSRFHDLMAEWQLVSPLLPNASCGCCF